MKNNRDESALLSSTKAFEFSEPQKDMGAAAYQQQATHKLMQHAEMMISISQQNPTNPSIKNNEPSPLEMNMALWLEQNPAAAKALLAGEAAVVPLTLGPDKKKLYRLGYYRDNAVSGIHKFVEVLRLDKKFVMK